MILIMNFILFLGLFISGAYVFVSNRKHLLVILLSLEIIVLSLFMGLFLILMNFNIEMYFLTMFLVFSVCEGVLGLSILVSMVRIYGNNYFQSFNILLC